MVVVVMFFFNKVDVDYKLKWNQNVQKYYILKENQLLNSDLEKVDTLDFLLKSGK